MIELKKLDYYDYEALRRRVVDYKYHLSILRHHEAKQAFDIQISLLNELKIKISKKVCDLEGTTKHAKLNLKLHFALILNDALTIIDDPNPNFLSKQRRIATVLGSKLPSYADYDITSFQSLIDTNQ